MISSLFSVIKYTAGLIKNGTLPIYLTRFASAPLTFSIYTKNILALHAWLTSYMPGSNMQNNCSAPLPSPFAISLNSAGMRMMYTLCGSLRKWRGWRLRNIEIALWCSILHFLLLTVISRIYISFFVGFVMDGKWGRRYIGCGCARDWSVFCWIWN